MSSLRMQQSKNAGESLPQSGQNSLRLDAYQQSSDQRQGDNRLGIDIAMRGYRQAVSPLASDVSEEDQQVSGS